MKKTPNPHAVKVILNLIAFFAIVAFFISILYGCSPTKQAARKDKAALERVTAKRALIDSVAPIVFDLYPCANDTFTTFLSGGIDSVAYPVPVFYEAKRKEIIDSLHTVFTNDCYAAVSASYDAGYNNATIDLKNKKVAVKRPDTLLYSIVDRQLHNQYEKQIAALRENAAALEEAVKQKDIQIAEGKKETRTFIWYFIAAVAACVLSNGLWVFGKLKNPLK
jgi:hypothetical protein